MEYEEFEVDEVTKEHTGILVRLYAGVDIWRWEKVLDVADRYFITGNLEIHGRCNFRRTLRRPIQKPKMKRVAQARIKSNKENRWLVADLLFESYEQAQDYYHSFIVEWPHGEFFEVPE